MKNLIKRMDLTAKDFRTQKSLEAVSREAENLKVENQESQDQVQKIIKRLEVKKAYFKKSPRMNKFLKKCRKRGK